MSLKNKLTRYRKELTSEKTSSETGENNNFLKDDLESYLSFWRDLNALEYKIDESSCLVREVEYPLNYKHGLYELSRFHDVVARWQQSGVAHPLSSANVSPNEIIFFDTETTGLGSAAGHMIFMLGTASVLRDRVLIKQYFLTGPGSEIAFYKKFLADITSLESLVTYNGKSFDWPKLKTRHTMLKKELPTLPKFAHFDLLHAARRFWKKTLPDVKLATIEKQILGISRNGDTPGYLAPIYYFDYLKTGNPSLLKGVFEHNEIDVLSLITLYTHLSELLLEDLKEEGNTSSELIEVAKWFEQNGENTEAISKYQQLITTNHHRKKEALKALGFLYKKVGNSKESISYFRQYMLENNTYDVNVGIELAKLYEHKEKDINKATNYAVDSYKEWKKQKRIFKTKQQKMEEMFIKRIERLKRKMK
ncbi:hypothetical protein CIB95_07615 [Lottiidibacillus patelloidae]|uniref:YprB ribonuclease H-like domain-containing protein n=1 Tax=Lottiidibacillus patelloidae TaxID=2670334 RepID=A0A263BUA1_9BACI|nr:ribonuclease H-like domain-containing protein [Lottiidibacillus patelloidae]OZM57323.1 hypothetical protein CIB95_07615 [Lottiidibacillus patelloidae]